MKIYKVVDGDLVLVEVEDSEYDEYWDKVVVASNRQEGV